MAKKAKQSKLEPNYTKWLGNFQDHLTAKPKGSPGKMDWRKLAEMHMQVEGTGMAPEAEAHLRTMAWWGRMSVSDQEEFKNANSFFGAEGGQTEGNWRWIASIPHNVVSALLHLNPDLFSDMKEFKKWLRTEGQQYKVPGAKV